MVRRHGSSTCRGKLLAPFGRAGEAASRVRIPPCPSPASVAGRCDRTTMAASNSSAHAGKTVTCTGVLTDDDGEPITKTQTIAGDDRTGEPPREVEVEQTCDTELNFEDHGRYERNLTGERRERFEQAALVFTCPDCGEQTAICPMCSEPPDTDDNSPAGWFKGESTGEQIPCHNCNQREISERRRHHGHSGKFGSRRRSGRF